MGKATGFMIVLQRHLWLNLADLKDADCKVLLNTPVTPSVESIIERFAEAQKCAKAMSHIMPRRAFQQQTTKSRSSLAPGSSQWRDNPRAAAAVGTATAPRQEPDVRRKAWGPGRKRHGRRRSLRRDSRPPPAAKPSSWRSEERMRAQERLNSQAPKVHKFKCLCVGCSFNKNAYILTQRALSSSLKPINRALCKRPFRMITLKQILAQIRPRNWFASVDLKDAHFHIQITPHHRRFLRFAFEGTAYQYSVLPFGLALASHTFVCSIF